MSDVFEQGIQDDDTALLLRYLDSGDQDAFAKLYRRYERELFSYLCKYLGNAEAGDDVMQEVWLIIHRKGEQFEEGKKFRPWLYTIATNRAIDFRRRNKRHRMVSLDRSNASDDAEDRSALKNLEVSPEPGPAHVAESHEERDALHVEVASLTPEQQKILHLVYFQGLKYREAAVICNIPLGTTKSSIHAIIKQLKTRKRYANVA